MMQAAVHHMPAAGAAAAAAVVVVWVASEECLSRPLVARTVAAAVDPQMA